MINYNYYNANPDLDTINDCVTRSICVALNIDYKDIARQLEGIGILYNCEKLCPCCYYHLLEKYYCCERIDDLKGVKIKDLHKYLDYGIYIIRVQGHLTTLIGDTIYDIWDCRNEIVDIIWKIE